MGTTLRIEINQDMIELSDKISALKSERDHDETSINRQVELMQEIEELTESLGWQTWFEITKGPF